jgi:CPA2 family monovalent cation:H+ antiporter-2
VEIPLLSDIFKLFALSVGVLFVCSKIKVPSIVGFLITGVVAGPHGLGIVEHSKAVEIMAEVGVVLLLFTIGLEYSIEQLLRIKKTVFLGGTLQVLITIAATVGLAMLLGLSLTQGVFVGFLLAPSGTAIALNIIQQRGEMESPHGKASLGILIFQDMAVVPMMLILPMLVGASGNALDSVIELGKGFLIIGVVFAAARWGVPKLLHQIAKTRDREFFLISIVAICLSVAWATNQVGLSLSLGAFLAGLIISESEYSQQAIGHVLPFKDVFVTIFFVSIGMLLDLQVVQQNALWIAGLTVGVLLLGVVTGGFATFFLGYPLRTLVLTGIALSSVGEFSFVLAKSGLDLGLMTAEHYQIFLAVSILTMVATPGVMIAAPQIIKALMALPLPEKVKSGFAPPPDQSETKNSNHLVVIGYGINGRNLATAARASSIPYDVVEMNPEVVQEERAKGEPVWFGDASSEAILAHVNAADAKAVAIAVSDPVATRRITQAVRRLNPSARIIVRTRFLKDISDLYELGASRVIPEEFETSIQIFSDVLQEFGKDPLEIDRMVAEARSNNYDLFLKVSKVEENLFQRIEQILVK